MSAIRRTSFVLLVSAGCLITSTASAATNQFRGVNWADPGDNYQSGVIYISGLSSSDTYSSASVVADRVMSQFISKLGANAVRMPINEATVSRYWATYTGAIDTVLSKGIVVFSFWPAAHGAKAADITAFMNMWATVVGKYGGNGNAYFEVFNEPDAYSKTDLGTLYAAWLTQFASVPRGRVILDGTGLAQNVPDIGGDSRFNGCLLAVHEYSMFGSTSWTTESQWTSHFKGYVGSYADRTVCTEWGGPMSAGSKNGISYGPQDYDSPPGTYFAAYLRATTSQLRAWNMGSFYWAGLKDGDWYSMATKSGSGSTIALSVSNQSGLDRMQYAWTYPVGDTDGGVDGNIDGGAAGAGDGAGRGGAGGGGGFGGATATGTGGSGGGGRGGTGALAGSSGGAAGASGAGGTSASGRGGAAGSTAPAGTGGEGGAGGRVIAGAGGAGGGAQGGAGGSSRGGTGSGVAGAGAGGSVGGGSGGSIAAGESASGCSCTVARRPFGGDGGFALLLGIVTVLRLRRKQKRPIAIAARATGPSSFASPARPCPGRACTMNRRSGRAATCRP